MDTRSRIRRMVPWMIKVILIYAKLILLLIFLIKVPTLIDIQHFVRSTFGIYLLFVVVYEPIAIILFSLCFSKLGARSKVTRVVGIVLFGNFHPNIINGLLYAVNNE
jgi:hypothetical protein